MFPRTRLARVLLFHARVRSWSARRATRSLVAVAGLVAGCGEAQPILCDGGACGTQISWTKNYQANIDRKLDILFVVDDTPAMEPNIGPLAVGFAGMAERLLLPYGPTSMHVGFVRAGRCDASTRATACDVDAPEQFMRAEWCRTMTNFGGPFTSTFACLADLGAANCGPAQPLAAAADTLTETARLGWEGFLRADAYLMIVVVSAADDASGSPGTLTPVADVAARIKALKADPSQVLVSMIGPGDCASGEEPGPRLTEFANQFGGNGISLGLCSGQLPAALDRVFQTVSTLIEPVCVSNVRDIDPVQPGLQADCTAVDRTLNPDGTWTDVPLPRCDESAPPCWRIVSNAGCNSFEIDRGADWCEEAGTNVTLECLGCAATTDPACALTR